MEGTRVTPALHFSPSSGWINDPNGLIYRDGRHHLFFQYEPGATAPQRLRWGHASSADLLSWTEHPPALLPDQPYDADGCWSGCAVDVEGRVALLYTGLRGRDQRPCLAWADDGSLLSFTKDAANPLIATPPQPGIFDFRDHTVLRADDRWLQRISGATSDGRATVFGYASDDFRTWHYTGAALDTTRSRIPGRVWECPDWFVLDGTDVLVLSVIHDVPKSHGSVPVPAEVWWSLGHDDGSRMHERAAGPLDVGDRFYAPQSYWVGPRRIMLGWVRTHHDPAWEAATGTAGVMSLPRRILVRGEDLHVLPAEELRAARAEATVASLSSGSSSSLTPSPVATGEVEVDATAAARLDAITLVGENGVEVVIDCAAFEDTSGALSLFYDGGVVEVFRGGRAGTWSNLRLGTVAGVVLSHSSGGSGLATCWTLHHLPGPPSLRPAPSGLGG